MTGCGCTDPVVFGHQPACERELGPSWAGGQPDPRPDGPSRYQAEYGPRIPARNDKCNISDYDTFCYTHGRYH